MLPEVFLVPVADSLLRVKCKTKDGHLKLHGLRLLAGQRHQENHTLVNKERQKPTE